ncbi:hypothetical protein DL768_011198 [Monosporascus sp. mg162]|nr:hypothetical protein DL768_011198 [Monosporascus sp. mg162]
MASDIEPFVYLLSYKVVIYKEYRFGYAADEVESHLGGGADHTASRHVKKIQKHCRTAYGWANPRARGGRRPAAAGEEGRPWREGVRYQRFFRSRAASGWFEVERGQRCGTGAGGGRGTGGSAAEAAAEADNNWKSMLAAYGGNLAAEKERRRRTADGPGGVDAESTWVKEMGWAKHLDGADLVELYEAGAGPISSAAWQKLRDAAARGEQRRLVRLGESFDREIARCVERFDAVPYETLRWLASIDPNKPEGRPFGTKDYASSMDRYRTYWKRYLCYYVRARRLGRDAAEARYRVRFSDAQWAALDGMARLLDGDGDGDGEDNGDGEDDGEGGAGTGGGRTEAQAFDSAVFEFCICSLKQKVAFRPAKNYTGQLAGILWCGRLLMLEHVFEGQPDNPDDMGVEIVERTIIRWMSYGKGYRRKEGSAARIMWKEGGEALRYLGQRIELREFRDAVRAGVRETEDLLDGLFFGGWADARASIETARLVDSMGGQPRRGPEIMTVRHYDTQQLLRNMFVFDGQVLLVTDRDKNKAIRGISRKVAQFLPEYVGKIMVAYVAWLLPFEKMLAARGLPAPSTSAPLPPDERKQLASATGRHLGVELTVADYRHVAIKLGRKIRGLVIRQLEVDIRADDGGGGGGGQAADGECGYDEDPATGEARLQPQMIANYREISRLWHQYLSLGDAGGGGGARYVKGSEKARLGGGRRRRRRRRSGPGG